MPFDAPGRTRATLMQAASNGKLTEQGGRDPGPRKWLVTWPERVGDSCEPAS